MVILKVIKFMILVVITIILMICLFSMLGVIIEKLFIPQEYTLWIFKYPLCNLIFLFEVYFVIILFYRSAIISTLKTRFIQRNKKTVLGAFVFFNLLLLYLLIFNVTVITNNKIIDYSFLSPQGNYYSFNDIVSIETGVYGKKKPSLSHYSKGDFYYIIQLNDGVKMHLTDVGGTVNDEDDRFVIEKLDRQFVNMGIPKTSSMDNFEFCTKHLDKIYTDKIRDIILNKNQ